MDDECIPEIFCEVIAESRCSDKKRWMWMLLVIICGLCEIDVVDNLYHLCQLGRCVVYRQSYFCNFTVERKREE